MSIKNAIEAVERTRNEYLKETTSKNKRILFGKVVEGKIRLNYHAKSNKSYRKNNYKK